MLFDKKGDETKIMSKENQEKLQEATLPIKDFHAVARKFKNETKDNLYREWEIFESRYGAVLNLKEDASKADVKRAVARVKRAGMDVRDALKELGRFTI